MCFKYRNAQESCMRKILGCQRYKEVCSGLESFLRETNLHMQYLGVIDSRKAVNLAVVL